MPRRKSKPRRGGRPTASLEDATAPLPRLPAWKAFIVQFTRESGVVAGVFAGRIEHLGSGDRVRFGSGQELLAILTREVQALKDRLE